MQLLRRLPFALAWFVASDPPIGWDTVAASLPFALSDSLAGVLVVVVAISLGYCLSLVSRGLVKIPKRDWYGAALTGFKNQKTKDIG